MPEIESLAPVRIPRAQEHHLTPSDGREQASQSWQRAEFLQHFDFGMKISQKSLHLK